MAYVYILRSQKGGRFYYGSTEDLENRLKAHNAGKVRSTKSRRPLVLHYSEKFDTKHEARTRELFFKSIAGYKWLRESGVIGELAERLVTS
jgi:putative endonuclease